MKKLVLAATAALISTPLLAADMATGDEILAAVSGNTVSGAMADGVVYAEFYAEDGTILADDYTGEWSVIGDEMCFDYGEGTSCWGLAIDGDTITWMNDGVAEGTGTIAVGNINDF